MIKSKELEIDCKKLDEFLEGIYTKYEVDFQEYGKAHLKRRIRHRLTISKYKTFDDLSEAVLASKDEFKALFKDFSINVTELFRDPEFYQQLYQILKFEKKDNPLRIWISASASGEEAYSVLMMLDHFGFEIDKIYATDFNPDIVEYAARGEIISSKLPEYMKNLEKTDFELNFDKYFYKKDTVFRLKEEYLEKIEFKTHNLMDSFGLSNFDLVLCRNVLIYFEKNLQNTVIDHLDESLKESGLLCLGSKESLRFMNAFQNYNTVDQTQKIYQKKTTSQ